MKPRPFTVFLPAAGLGERLRPITNHLPKPLLPILGEPIIEGVLERLAPVSIGRIGINLHWKPELIRQWAENSPWAGRIDFFPEETLLGTGGALKNAERFLSEGPFLVHNADIILDIDFAALVEAHLSAGNLATLVCHRLPDLSNVVIDEQGQVLEVENPGESRPDPGNSADKTAYTGIAVYSPGFLEFLPPGVSHATVAWIAASRAGKRVRIYDVTGAYWSDVGNPATYARAVLDALAREGETIYRSASAFCDNVRVDGQVVLESGCRVASGATLRNCIVLPNAEVSGEQEDRIIGPGCLVDLPESAMQPGARAAATKTVLLTDPLFAGHFSARAPLPDLPVPVYLIGTGGSDRRYYRVRHGGKSAVLMECRPDDPDFERHLVYTRFFESHGIPVPALLASRDPARQALFEDLGDLSLYAYLKMPRTQERIEEVYRDVLDIAVRLHSRATADAGACPLLQARIFDYDYLRWETSYFVERFVRGHLGREPRDRAALDEEFHRLAKTTDAFPKAVIHRDFQSQNIMLRRGAVHVIDFQGARMAPPAYDVVSILRDPYSRIDDRVRGRLIDYYAGEMKRDSPAFLEALFRDSLVPCGLQRHMQALGAYGFLSAVKGKKYFLKHVPEALRLLKEDLAAARGEYPELHRLVRGLPG
jgi:NDP-sugar pyrophosphorylase family protein/aminoglycoside/choline kinase family phosphotransferase